MSKNNTTNSSNAPDKPDVLADGKVDDNFVDSQVQLGDSLEPKQATKGSAEGNEDPSHRDDIPELTKDEVKKGRTMIRLMKDAATKQYSTRKYVKFVLMSSF